MQRPDGSFGETLGADGYIEGGLDTRFGYCATGVRWMIRGSADGPLDDVPDIDAEKLVHCIRSRQVGTLASLDTSTKARGLLCLMVCPDV